MAPAIPFDAILFDKDGTLTDFRATWEPWLASEVPAIAAVTGASPATVARVFGFDLATGRLAADAPFVTNSNAQTMAALAPAVGWDVERLAALLDARASDHGQVPVPGVEAVLRDLAAAAPLGILTNAVGAEAEAHLRAMGLRDLFVDVVGCDRHGPKPDPAGALAFAGGLGLAPGRVLVVGDGMTDMRAAARAGMPAVAVLTGTLGGEALAPHARAVLRDVTALPRWLAAQGA